MYYSGANLGASRGLFSFSLFYLESASEYALRKHKYSKEDIIRYFREFPQELFPSQFGTCISPQPMTLQYVAKTSPSESMSNSDYEHHTVEFGETIQIVDIRTEILPNAQSIIWAKDAKTGLW